ncbi:MAG: AI-2E family transporter [Chloroflexota bacterium]|nr:AI-2E family transporter [Chloroflexota bacterium]
MTEPTAAPPTRVPGAPRVAVQSPGPRLIWLALATLVVLWLARGILAPFVIAGVIAYAFTPLIDFLAARSGLPRWLVVTIAYLLVVAVLIGLLVFLGGRLALEVQTLAQQGPNAIAYALHQLLRTDVIQLGDNRIPVSTIAQQLQVALAGALAGPRDAVHIAGLVADVALQTILTLIVTFYLLLDGPRFLHFALGFVPEPHRDRAELIGHRIHVVLGRWLRGQLILIAGVALVVYVALGPILHVPGALAIAVATGVLEIIPLVGPLLAGAIAALMALSSGGIGLAITVVVIFVVLRQVEDQLVMPVLIGRVVHLHPVMTIFAVLVGISAWGILGGLLAVPAAAALNVTLQELYPAGTPPAAPPAAALDVPPGREDDRDQSAPIAPSPDSR